MNTKNNTKKKKESIFSSKNLIVLGISAAVVILFSIVTALLFPPETPEQFEEPTSGVSSLQDSGLTSVYPEEAVETIAAPPVPVPTEEPLPAEEPTPVDENTQETAPEETKQAYIFPVSGSVTKDYSGDELVYSETLKDWRTHNGIDFRAEEGTDVLAVADGTVEAVLENGMMGRSIVILHTNGIRTIYSNLAEGNEVKAGDSVTQGTPIGKVGSSASAEALEEPHLHFEVSLNEETVSPHDYLPDISNNEE